MTRSSYGLEMDPDEGDEGDRIVFTSSPWTRVG
jgi:hypothetical protein